MNFFMEPFTQYHTNYKKIESSEIKPYYLSDWTRRRINSKLLSNYGQINNDLDLRNEQNFDNALISHYP